MKNRYVRIEPELSQIYLDKEFPYLSYKRMPNVIGLTGPTKCGKTIMAERLVTGYGFQYVNLSSIITRIARLKGEEITGWEVIGNIGKKYREIQGSDIFAKLGMEDIQKILSKNDKVIVDGLLHPDEINYFLEFPFFSIIGIDSELSIRAKAASSWYDIKEKVITSDLLKRDAFEQYSKNRRDNLAPNIAKCLRIASKSNEIIKVTGFNQQTIFNQIEKRVNQILKI